ncbi:hypothetical protein DY000_02004838 [Brassica cretica]|uniref:Uncharacterized protein n=1 Tax=Brassica cretica TaxID=69181 RepID=A0ABQ7BW77_BRACR|nr:hypothetical protein DY000_02004838 [Brassica cretica]
MNSGEKSGGTSDYRVVVALEFMRLGSEMTEIMLVRWCYDLYLVFSLSQSSILVQKMCVPPTAAFWFLVVVPSTFSAYPVFLVVQ